jgi:hypothetical protein
MKAEVQEPEEHKEAAPKAAAAAVEASKAAAAAVESPKAAAAGTVSVISGGSVVRFGSIAEALESAKPSSKIEITGAHAGQHLIIPSQLKGFSLSLSLSHGFPSSLRPGGALVLCPHSTEWTKENWTVLVAIVVLDNLLSREGRQCKLAGMHGVCLCACVYTRSKATF